MASDSGDDAAALRERVAQLEETVAEQHHSSESPAQPTASRRGFVKAAAAVAGFGALGIYSSYPASAQASGQIGTSSEPVDVEAYDLNVQGTANGLVQNPLAGDLDAGGNSVTNAAAVEAESATITDGSSITINIPSDEPTFGDAIQRALGTFRRRDSIVTINIESGETIDSGVVFSNVNLGFVTITSDDLTVDFTAADDFILGFNCWLPTLDTTVIATDANAGFGYRARRGSVGKINGTNGGLRSFDINCDSRGYIRARNAELTNGRRNANASRGGVLNVDEADLSGATQYAIRCAGNAHIGATNATISNSANPSQTGIRASNSASVLANGATATNCVDNAINATHSAVSAPNATFDDAGNNAVVGFHANLRLDGSTIKNAGADALAFKEQTRATVKNAVVTGTSGSALFATDGSVVGAEGIDLSDASNKGCFISGGAQLDINSSTVDASGNNGIQAFSGGRINAESASITNTTGVGVLASRGSDIRMFGGSATGSSDIDIEVLDGGLIFAEATDTTNSTGADPHTDDIRPNSAENAIDPMGVVIANIEP